MNSPTALRIVEESYPKCTIVECPGNPNMMGWYLFTITDATQPGLSVTEEVWVTEAGHIIAAEAEDAS